MDSSGDRAFGSSGVEIVGEINGHGGPPHGATVTSQCCLDKHSGDVISTCGCSLLEYKAHRVHGVKLNSNNLFTLTAVVTTSQHEERA